MGWIKMTTYLRLGDLHSYGRGLQTRERHLEAS